MLNSQVLRDMALFVEVAKRQSFSRAAAALEMPISSLSRRITLFEEAVGVRLLDRTTRKIALTSYGESYLAQAAQLVEDAQRTFDDLIAEAKGPIGFLKIAAPPDIWALQNLSTVISAFSEDHENIRVQIDIQAAAVDLHGDRYDLAVAVEPPRETSLVVRKVAEVRNGIFAAPSYLEAHGRPETPMDLLNHWAIVPDQSACWTVSRPGSDPVDVTVSGPIVCNSPTLTRRFAAAGHGVFVANLINAAADVANGTIERVLPEWQLPRTPIYIVTTSRLLPAKTRSFIDFAAKHLPAALAAAAAGESPAGRTAHPGGADRSGPAPAFG